jgi:alkylation response protein AidB-like acyl-CoA dehydrogenase
MSNPLVSDRNLEFILDETHDAAALCSLPYYADHSRETFAMFLRSARDLAREVLDATYRPMDEHAPTFSNGRVQVHPLMKELWPRLVELGVLNCTRPAEVGGQQLPSMVAFLGGMYLQASNLSAAAYAGLTTGAAHLIEAFGSDELKRAFMEKMYGGEWTGTMALTEPQAGSSLADVQTRASPAADGTYRIAGSKVFITGGDEDFTENIVHLVLARIDGAAPGTKGVSLFAVPRLRPSPGGLVDNDVATAGAFHKLGWRGIPSCALNFGERSDCHGWLVGQAGRGLNHMFVMMNDARLAVGMNAVATASAAYRESLEYARTRPQGRKIGAAVTTPQIPILEHADVRRMLLRQKSTIEGCLSLLITCARHHDLALHSTDEAVRARSQLLLDLLTPVAKSFSSERGFECNALAVQIHGGYGYTSEYRPEAWLRDQKLNTIHEGTTGIQSLDLLGRKAVAQGGAALVALGEEIAATIARAAEPALGDALASAWTQVCELTTSLGARGLEGDVEGMLLHSVDYLELFSIVCVAWQWLLQAAAAKEARVKGSEDFYAGKLAAARYWFATELPRVSQLCALVQSGERSYLEIPDDGF